MSRKRKDREDRDLRGSNLPIIAKVDIYSFGVVYWSY